MLRVVMFDKSVGCMNVTILWNVNDDSAFCVSALAAAVVYNHSVLISYWMVVCNSG